MSDDPTGTRGYTRPGQRAEERTFPPAACMRCGHAKSHHYGLRGLDGGCHYDGDAGTICTCPMFLGPEATAAAALAKLTDEEKAALRALWGVK